MSSLSFQTIINVLPAILIGLTFHEYMHAKVAHILGDDTAYMQGRVSLNPIKHIDWLGFAFLIIAGFGWAKPVTFNPEKLRNPRRDEMLIAIAGPVANLILAFVFAVLLKIYVVAIPVNESVINIWLQNVLLSGIFINFGLFVFNLIPIPPLDGSHLLIKSIKMSRETEQKIFRYGSFALLAVIIIDTQTDFNILPIGKAISFLTNLTLGILNI
jgi:Zn-dependent protease